MKNLKVVKVNSEYIVFNNNVSLCSEHQQDCCEHHYLCFDDLNLDDFDGLEFDLSDDKFFRRIEGYGIELIPIKGYSVKVPGYGYNNGYYSSDLKLELVLKGNVLKSFDISDCQNINWE